LTSLFRILSLWRGAAFWLLAGLLLSIAALLTGVALLTASGEAIARGWSGAATPELLWLVAGLPAALLLRWLGVGRVVLRYLERLVTHGATFRALAGLRVWFFRGFAARSAGGLGFRRSGDAVSRLVDDIEALDGLYLRILVPLVGALVLLPVLCLLIGTEDRPLAFLVGGLFVTAAFVLPAVAAHGARAGGRAVSQAGAGLRIVALDALTGLREVRAFGAEDRMLTVMQTAQARLISAQTRLARRGTWANAAAFLCAQGAVLAVLAATGLHPLASIALLFLTVAAFDAVPGLPRAGALAGHAAEAAERVLEAAAPVAGSPTGSATMSTGSALRFEAVGFRWQPDRAAVFDGLTLEVPQGARVAVLGPSGSGKSTLAALALKVVVPQTGRVLFGGADIAGLAEAGLRSRIGWLSQATHLFNDTVRRNLLLGRPDATDEALWAALDSARIADHVRGLPDGLDSWVGESGRGFSGGQGRRLVLARALLSPAPLLILDEPCTGLDSENERAFLTTLNEAIEGRSLMLIVHRLTGVERLDRIWRLSAGHAVAAAA